eukprot:PhM_4_TR16524/c0_g1_i1/m.40712/K01634/SGPL1, DPL1; sphinganine-1-phosphate aldolase
MDFITNHIDKANAIIRDKDIAPVKLVAVSAIGGVLLYRIYTDVVRPGDYSNRAYKKLWRTIRFFGKSYINKEIEKNAKAMDFGTAPKECLFNDEVYRALPEQGLPAAEIERRAKFIHSKMDVSWESGIFSGCVYLASPELTSLVNNVCAEFQWTNPLHVDAFAGVRLMETQVVSMCARMYRGGPDVCGVVTGGGTESILMAVKSYREWAREKKWITEPELVMCLSGHPAFDKACGYFGIKLRKARVDHSTGRVDVKHLRSLVTSNTIAIVGSAPCFPSGTVDPIPELAKIAKAWGIGLHVDCCLGSFIVPYIRDELCAKGLEFDFAVDGVTTISCDTHKYGGAPKGTSVLMYKNPELRRYQVFATSEWPGGVYASPGMMGSRPGNVVAGTWAAMMYFGEDGYRRNAEAIVGVARQFAAFIESVPELELYGSHDGASVAFHVRRDLQHQMDIFRVFQNLHDKGWALVPLQFPSGIACAFTLQHTRKGVIERLMKDLKDSVEEVKKSPQPATGQCALYGSTQTVPDRTIVDDVLKHFVDAYFRF